MSLINPQQWAQFKASQADAHKTFMTHDIVWLKANPVRDRFGEDGIPTYTRITLKCLLNYNYLRTWPITQYTATGELDRQSTQVLLSKPGLKELGHLNSKGNFDYNPAEDRFEIHGRIYKSGGDTDASQIDEDDLLFTIIIQPEKEATGQDLR